MDERGLGEMKGQQQQEMMLEFPFDVFTVDRERKLVQLKSGWNFQVEGVYDDLQLLTSARNGASAPTLALYRGGIYGWSFAAASVDSLHGSLELPHSYKEGSDLEVHVHWKTNSTSAAGGGVTWGIEYVICNPEPGSVEAGVVTLSATETVAAVNQNGVQHSFVVGTIPGTGLKVSALIDYRIFRDGAAGSDTFPAACWVDSFAIHFKKDMDGSRFLWVK